MRPKKHYRKDKKRDIAFRSLGRSYGPWTACVFGYESILSERVDVVKKEGGEHVISYRKYFTFAVLCSSSVRENMVRPSGAER